MSSGMVWSLPIWIPSIFGPKSWRISRLLFIKFRVITRVRDMFIVWVLGGCLSLGFRTFEDLVIDHCGNLAL
ncbi:hypothetical protein ACLOJK_023288 [Asimina triloba]